MGWGGLVTPPPAVRSVRADVPLRQRRKRPMARGQGRAVPGVPLFVAFLLVIVAAVVAPEQPRDQEAICHRHSGEVACRVW